MKGYAIKNMKETPDNDASATSRKYVDRKIGAKPDKKKFTRSQCRFGYEKFCNKKYEINTWR